MNTPEVEIFEDRAGEWRYRIKAANGEGILTSEGYTRKADAERGFETLMEVIAQIAGAMLAGTLEPLELKSERPTIRQLPELPNRIETGPVQFGDDWPGVFIRGDNAFGYAMNLLVLLKGEPNDLTALHKLYVGGLAKLLQSSNLHGGES